MDECPFCGRELVSDRCGCDQWREATRAEAWDSLDEYSDSPAARLSLGLSMLDEELGRLSIASGLIGSGSHDGLSLKKKGEQYGYRPFVPINR